MHGLIGKVSELLAFVSSYEISELCIRIRSKRVPVLLCTLCIFNVYFVGLKTKNFNLTKKK